MRLRGFGGGELGFYISCHEERGRLGGEAQLLSLESGLPLVLGGERRKGERGKRWIELDIHTFHSPLTLQYAAIISFYGNSACSSYYDGALTTIAETASIRSDCQRTRGYISRASVYN